MSATQERSVSKVLCNGLRWHQIHPDLNREVQKIENRRVDPYPQLQKQKPTKHQPPMDPQIFSSIIIGSSTILATVLGAGTAWLIGRKISRRQKLQDDLDRAVRDIHFLLAVEEAHCARNKASGNDSFKLRTRNAVRESSDADFSGRFTPGNWKASE